MTRKKLQNSGKSKAQTTLVIKGLSALVEQLGASGAAEFLAALGKGKGNSVQELKEMWKGKTLEEVCAQIAEAREKGILK